MEKFIEKPTDKERVMMMMKFTNYTEYECWTDTFENPGEYEEIPVAIDDGWKISMDMITSCKSYKTALRRFEKTFSEVSGEIAAWVEFMKESCEAGFFRDSTGWMPAWSNDPEVIKENCKNGIYSWGVEETMEGYWYVFLNISGIYAGREAV